MRKYESFKQVKFFSFDTLLFLLEWLICCQKGMPSKADFLSATCERVCHY
jgi:hypothetical protein